jgi:hypothetical protein
LVHEAYLRLVGFEQEAKREAYLKRECAGDPALRDRLAALLAAHDRAGHVIDHPVNGDPDQTAAFAPASEQPGTIISNIAKVLDGGITESGRPYFVMEYVKGVPITAYCDATRLSVEERLNLFIQVCFYGKLSGLLATEIRTSDRLEGRRGPSG